MTTDREIGRKEEEREALLRFLDAYVLATGQPLTVVEEGENPDFVCLRPSGLAVGVELTKITRSPVDAHWDRILKDKEALEPFEAQELILDLIARKESARAKRYSQRVSQCLLVLQLVDGSLEEVRCALEGLQDEFASHSFAEIWIADYSGLDAYGDVELYGLFPEKYWSLHERPNADRKPYG